MNDEHVFDLLPGYALGLLDEEDLVSVARHLPRCVECRRELEDYLKTTNELGFTLGSLLPQPVPPRDLRAKVIARVEARAIPPISSDGLVGASQPPSARPGGFLSWLGVFFTGRGALALGALALVIIVLLGLGEYNLSKQVNALQARVPAGDVKIIHLAGTTSAPEAVGYMVVFPDNHYGTLVVNNAPLLDADHQYQIWMTRDGQRFSGGVFSVTDDGYGSMMIEANQPLEMYQSFGITIEPKGGSPGPTGKKILGSQ